MLYFYYLNSGGDGVPLLVDQPQQEGGADAANLDLDQVLRQLLQVNIQAGLVVVPLHGLGDVGRVVHSLHRESEISPNSVVHIQTGSL